MKNGNEVRKKDFFFSCGVDTGCVFVVSFRVACRYR
jgi:hypothetical protein